MVTGETATPCIENPTEGGKTFIAKDYYYRVFPSTHLLYNY